MKYLLPTLLALMLSLSLQAESANKPLPRSKPSAAAMESFENYKAAVAQAGLDIHGIMVLQHGKVILSNWWEGHSPEEKHIMMSVTKSFTSMAVGMLVEEGRLDIEAPVLSFFPDEAPENPSENMKLMKVKHLLTMTTGFDAGTGKEGRFVGRYLAMEPKYLPGTHFCYDSNASHMLSAIVQKITGEKMADFLAPRLFEPLGIVAPKWSTSREGITHGGFGLEITTEDMARFGLMLLHKGKFAGRQVVPAGWIQQATSWKCESRPSGSNPESLSASGITFENSDWRRGYGYQFWLTSHNAYRATGAYAQFIIVLPEKDAVIVHTAHTKQTEKQSALDLIWQHLYPIL